MCSAPVPPDVPPEHGGRTGSSSTPEAIRPLLKKGAGKTRFWGRGEPFVWASGAALAATLLMTATAFLVVLANGLSVFWPHPIEQVERLVAVLDRDGTLTTELREQAEAARHAAEGLDGATTGNGEANVLPDGTVVLPQGAHIAPDGTIALVVGPDGTVPLIQQTSIPEDWPLVTVPLYEGAAVADALAEGTLTGPDGKRVTRQLDDGRLTSTLLGERLQSETNPDTRVERVKFKTGNREDGAAFRWIEKTTIVETTLPDDAVVLNRMENLDYIGFLERIDAPGLELAGDDGSAEQLAAALDAARAMEKTEIEPLLDQEKVFARELADTVKYPMIEAKYRRQQLLTGGAAPDSPAVAEVAAALEALAARETELMRQSDELADRRLKREEDARANVAVFADATGQEKSIPLVDIVRAATPNNMGFGSKLGYYLSKTWGLLTDDPREANQDGGLFPAIFGTVLLVFLMAVTCFPLGVLAGIYLGEYAKDGPLVRLVRVAVNNLAGIPSIVYGIFGLGFFVYLCGGSLDRWLFPAEAASGEPVLGQGCILWASLTLGLLTIPVVIVATEEALRAIPRGVREGSYALGATKLQTLSRVLIPMASPGMMTGFILAMARAAGEVAPLMITGAVKSAPVPFDGGFPYLHLNRQFMHLGFHIFDLSCKSPNVEATKPMVYVTTLLLLAIVMVLSSVAIYFRNRMRARHQYRAI